MSNKELDNLFKNKLTELEKDPSASAWDKVRAQTDTKKAVWPWVRIAASILLLFTIGATIWITSYLPKSNTNFAEVTPDKSVEKKKSEMAVVEKDIKPITSDEQNSQPKETDKAEVTNVKRDKIEPTDEIEEVTDNQESLVAKQKNVGKLTEKTQKPLPTFENLDTDKKIAVNNVADATIEEVNASTEQEPEVTGKTIEINLEDFAKTSIAQNESKVREEKKTEEKGLGKVLNLMKEIKSEAGIGDLREAKNEILAFNFKKQQNEDSK